MIIKAGRVRSHVKTSKVACSVASAVSPQDGGSGVDPTGSGPTLRVDDPDASYIVHRQVAVGKK